MPSVDVVRRVFRAWSPLYDAAPMQLLLFHRLHDTLRSRLRQLRAGTPMELIVDVGTGTGEALRRLAPMARHVVGIDVSLDMLEHARPKTSANTLLVQASAMDLPLATASADAVVSTFSMHWWPDLDRGFGELHRITRPGGIVLAAVPSSRLLGLPLVKTVADAVAPSIAHLAPPRFYVESAKRAGFDTDAPRRLWPFGYLVEARR